MIKIIKDFNINTSSISLDGGHKNFIITGDNGAKFTLFATMEKSNELFYYNFTLKSWQLNPVDLKGEITSDKYENYFQFPPLSAAVRIDLFLLADDISQTEHAPYVEALDAQGDIDINNSTGSNSLMLKKKIEQVANGVLTLVGISPNNAAGFVSATFVSDTLTLPVGNVSPKIPFSISVSAAAGSVLKIDRQPLESDFFALLSRNIGVSSILPGEDVFDAGQTARSTGKVVDGDVTTENVTMDDDVGSFWAVGDRITGNAALDAKTGVNAVTITAINVGSNAKVFTMSEAVAIANDTALTFIEPFHRRWNVNNTENLAEGMALKNTYATANSFISSYVTQEEGVITNSIEGITSLGSTNSSYTEGRILTTTKLGEIIFNNGQSTSLKEVSVELLAYGTSLMYKCLNSTLNIEITDLKAEITKPTTTTTAAVVNSDTVLVALGHGIMDDVSTVSSVNMDSSTVDPTVTNIASYSSTTATLTLSAAQTLENGETLTFDRAAQLVTITGNIKVKSTTGNNTVRLDVEKFLTGVTIF